MQDIADLGTQGLGFACNLRKLVQTQSGWGRQPFAPRIIASRHAAGIAFPSSLQDVHLGRSFQGQ